MENNLISKCRLCSSNLVFKFSNVILGKYKINYFECENCLSLQTENPYWIEEAYDDWITKYDTGAYARTEKTSLVSLFICKIFKFKNVIDVGGGDGLFCRILRDYNINCFSSDKYSNNLYSRIFTKPNFKNPDLLTCFEAVEHFENPKEELEKIFKLNPRMFLFTTSIYNKQDQNWDYLEYQTGQHIFFFSKDAIKKIGKKYNYQVLFLESGFILMTSNNFQCNKITLYFLKNILIREKFFQLLRIIKIFFKARGYEKDYNYTKEK
jgi:hypothetical protein